MVITRFFRRLALSGSPGHVPDPPKHLVGPRAGPVALPPGIGEPTWGPGRRAGQTSTRPGVLQPALLLSAALHAAAVGALLLPHGGPDLLPRTPPIEVELIQASLAGDAAPAAAPAMPEAASTAQADAPGRQANAPDAPALPHGPMDAQAPDAASRPPARQATGAAPAVVNLGDGGRDLASLDARSDDLVPPKPDSRYRNLPPAYPADAARRRETGSVHLVIHVSVDGVPVQVEVAGSSGHPSLDQAAVRALQRWRFTPAQGIAGPVPFSYPLNINFIGDRP